MDNLFHQIQNDIIEYPDIKDVLNLSLTNKDYCDLCQPIIKEYLIKTCKELKTENTELKKEIILAHFHSNHHIKIRTNDIVIYSLDLPYQILDTIADYFDNKTILNLSLLNRYYYDLCQPNIKIYLIENYKNLKKENEKLKKAENHSRTPADGINLYSFVLYPEEHQPTGTCTLTPINYINHPSSYQ